MTKLTLLSLLLGVTLCSYAQNDLENLLSAGQADASKLIQGYTQPVLTSLAYGLNQGWYTTAKPHKPLGFDLTVTVSAVFIPDKDLFFNVNALNLQEVRLVSPTDGSAPTVYGPDVTPRYEYIDAPAIEFNGPAGLDPPKAFGRNIFPAPVAHIGIGIVKNTDLRFRFLPNIDLGDKNYFRLFGVGMMHDVKQYIPGVKKLPFDLSLFGAFTQLKAQANLDGTFPDNGTEQLGQYKISAWTVQALISKKISVLTFYAGVGYNSASTSLSIKGSYELFNTPFGNPILTDPVSISLSESGFRATGGLRLKFGFFTLHGDYTLQERNIFSAGFGFSFR